MSVRLEAHGLEVRAGRFRLGPLDLVVEAGEYLVLVGPSGAGKTLLVETLLGWNAQAAGEVLLDGRPVRQVRPGARGFAYLPQDLGILPHLSVAANLTWGVDCRGEQPDRATLERVVGMLGVAPLLDRRNPATLSRGEQQRVALGRALLTRPAWLFLDEPCAAVDPHRRGELQLLLRTLHRELGMAVVHVTHDREEAFLLGGRIAVLLDGRLRQVTTPRELYEAPGSADVARFLAPDNLWPVSLVGSDVGGAAVRLRDLPVELVSERPLPAGGDGLYAGIRPEEVMVLDPVRPLRPQVARNVLDATVEEVVLLDGRAQARLRSREGLVVTVRLPVCAAQDLALAGGAVVRVCLKARSLYVVA